MTLENVAAEAGVNKASIRYNFGNKAGLVTAVLDSYIHDECLRLVATTRDVPPEEVVDTAVAGMRNMVVEADNFSGLLRHPALRLPRARAARAHAGACTSGGTCRTWPGSGLRDVPGVEQNETLVGLGELVCAVIDGLCIQAGLQPDGFDMGRAMNVFGLLLRQSMDELRAAAGVTAAAGEG